MKTWVSILLICVGMTAQAQEEQNIVFITLDGVRWQEFFNGPDKKLSPQDQAPLFPYFWGELASKSVILGNKDLKNVMTTAHSSRMSLPAYQSIMAGSRQPCSSNKCGRIQVETLPEYFQRIANLIPGAVAIISSWKTISDALEQTPGRVFSSTGLDPLIDVVNDNELISINEAQVDDIPEWNKARKDKYTFSHSMRYLKLHKPRFLWISLDDSDEWGHKNKYPEYLESLRQYDMWIYEVVETLKTMGSYGKNTTVMVTTDHGRGKRKNWKEHGFFLPSSKNIWLFAMGPKIQPLGVVAKGKKNTHLDIRPTIESLLGLPVTSCKKCGTPIQEIIGSDGILK